MASVPNWILDKKVEFIAQLGLSKSVNMPGVPLAMDLIENADDRSVYQLLAIQEEFGRPFLMPPSKAGNGRVGLRAPARAACVTTAADSITASEGSYGREKKGSSTTLGIAGIDERARPGRSESASSR